MQRLCWLLLIIASSSLAVETPEAPTNCDRGAGRYDTNGFGNCCPGYSLA